MPSVLVFDLDGTLVSSGEDLIDTLNVVLVDAGHMAVAPETVEPMVGLGAKALLQRGLDTNGISWTDAMIAPLFEAFLDHYEQNLSVRTRPYPGVVAALDRFRRDGWRLAVCTNKSERLTRPMLDQLDLARHFDAVVAGDTFARPKPDAMPVLGAIARADGTPAGSIMVGDSVTDINAARAAGIPVIAVDFGYTPVPVAELGPDRIISHFDELAAAIDSLSARAVG